MEHRYQRVQQLLAFKAKHKQPPVQPASSPARIRPGTPVAPQAILKTSAPAQASRLGRPTPATSQASGMEGLPADYQSPSAVLRRFKSAMLSMADKHLRDDKDVRLRLYTLDDDSPPLEPDGNHQR